MDAERQAYDELSAYTMSHGDPSFIHQHVVDAFIAQRADATTKPIGLTFALVGLYLRTEKRQTGRYIQRLHMEMGRRKRQWPEWTLPADRGAMTAIDVMRAPAGGERDNAIDAWCTSVWNAFSSNRAAISALLQEYDFE